METGERETRSDFVDAVDFIRQFHRRREEFSFRLWQPRENERRHCGRGSEQHQRQADEAAARRLSPRLSFLVTGLGSHVKLSLPTTALLWQSQPHHHHHSRRHLPLTTFSLHCSPWLLVDFSHLCKASLAL